MDTKMRRALDNWITTEPEPYEEGSNDDYYQSIIDECPDECEACGQIGFHIDFCELFF